MSRTKKSDQISYLTHSRRLSPLRDSSSRVNSTHHRRPPHSWPQPRSPSPNIYAHIFVNYTLFLVYFHINTHAVCMCSGYACMPLTPLFRDTSGYEEPAI